jgi:hypothetical protein
MGINSLHFVRTTELSRSDREHRRADGLARFQVAMGVGGLLERKPPPNSFETEAEPASQYEALGRIIARRTPSSASAACQRAAELMPIKAKGTKREYPIVGCARVN